MNANVVNAIFRRNFFSYFTNPTGYVFICLFVVLSSFAAFWPNEFFNANLANLDQLNRYLPDILLVFIPAITMSIWADERRQGTDELLLTLPANDFDVVLGKYLAAVAIFSVSLMFSLFCNLLMLRHVGNPDLCLFSGQLCRLLAGGAGDAGHRHGRLVLHRQFHGGVYPRRACSTPRWCWPTSADVITGSAEWTLNVKAWSLAEQFRDFGRGVISLSSDDLFLLIVVAMLYLSMVMIGRRHWLGGATAVRCWGIIWCGPALIVAAVAWC